MRMSIAGIVFELSLPSEALAQRFARRYAPFLSTQAPVWQVALEWNEGVAGADKGYIRHDGAVTHFQIHAHRGWIDLAQRRANVSTPSETLAPSAVERVLAFASAQELARQGEGMLIHAAGLLWKERGHLFFGASGRGKSTVARLMKGVGTVWGDENVVVRRAPDGWRLWSTPLWSIGTTDERIATLPNESVPLAALYDLSHGTEFALHKLHGATAAMALLASEKGTTERLESAEAWLAVADLLIKEVPVYRLRFSPTEQLPEFLERALS